MSVKDVLAAIITETERRQKIWDQMQKIALEAVNAVQEQATKRGVEGTEWVCDHFGFDSCFVDDVEGKIAIQVSPIGVIFCDREEREENHICQGYPPFSESAPKQFEQKVVEALMRNLTAYCDKQAAR